MEIEEAEEEGINFIFLTNPTKVVLDENGRAKGIECVKMELGPPDDSGRRRPIPIEGSNYVMEMDWVIAAIGQKADLEFTAKDNKLVNIKKSRWGTLDIKQGTMETNIPGVFSGGDVVLGPATAIEAIADGRKAAEAIHKYLTGDKLDLPNQPFLSRRDNFKKLTSTDFNNISKTIRQKMAVRDPEKRKKDWNEIELGFTPDQVYQEAIRCLECGCQAFYDCDLQKHSTEYQAVQEHFPGEYHEIEPDKSHPFIQIELNKCVLCGRCVRVCDEVMGLGVFGFVERGFSAKVKPVLETPLAETHCISCGQCVETCPTGAIEDKADALKPGPWVLDRYPTICQYCSVGCSMQADVLDDRVIKVSADPKAEVNEYGNLCVRGRYGFRYVNDKNRLKQPYIRRNGELEPASWQEALDFAALKIKEQKENDSKWAVMGSPHSSNEENYLLQKFARTNLSTNNIGSFSNLNHYPEQLLRASMSNTTFQEIENSDFILVCNFDPIETNPVLYIKLQKAARRGQTIYMGGYPDSRLAKKSKSLSIPDDKKVLFLKYIIDTIYRRGLSQDVTTRESQDLLNDLFNSVAGISQRMDLSEFNLTKKNFDNFFKDLVKAKTPIFMCHQENANAEVIHWLNSLGYVLGRMDSFLAVTSASNFQGMLDMGMLPEYLPGYQRVDNPQVIKRFSENWDRSIPSEVGLSGSAILDQFNAGDIKSLVLWGQDPVGTGQINLNRAKDSFVMVADMFMTETAQNADVVFPLVPFTESTGTVTNAEARVQQFKTIIKPLSGYANWQILVELSRRIDYPLRYQSAHEITEEIMEAVPEYKKGIAIFRIEYIPNSKILEKAVDKKLAYGANYLENWFDNYMEKTGINNYHSQKQLLHQEAEVK